MSNPTEMDDMFDCLQCSHQAASLFQLGHHVQRKHYNAVGGAKLFDAIIEPEHFSCVHCNYKSYYRFNVYEHYKQVHNSSSETRENEPFFKECHTLKYCSYETNLSSSLLKLHDLVPQRQNSTEKIVNTLKCEHCEFRTVHASRLETHMLKHVTSTKPVDWLKCNHCSYRCRRSLNLKRHTLKHANDNEISWLQCHECSYRSREKSELKKHMLRHAANKDSRCTSSFQSKDESSLKRHMRQHASNEETQHNSSKHATNGEISRSGNPRGEMSEHRKTGTIGIRGRAINSQAKEVINNVINFMKREAQVSLETGSPVCPLQNFRERVLQATGISKNTFQKISREGRSRPESADTPFVSPKRTRKKAKCGISKLIDLCPGETHLIRETIRNFCLTEKRRPSVKGNLVGCKLNTFNNYEGFLSNVAVHQRVRETCLSYTGTVTTTWRLFKTLDFKWQKTVDNRKVLVEAHDIRLKRIQFLKKMQYYRDNGYNIVYTGDTYIHSTHGKSHESSYRSAQCSTKPISKGGRLIIAHAGGDRGFVPGCLLLFRSGCRTGDYHDDMNGTNFFKWVTTQLLPNLPRKSVVVVNNACYHNIQEQRAPSFDSNKNEIIDWLTKNNIHHNPRALKPELYELLRQNKMRSTKYKLDSVMNQHGHKVLRLPPYHPELNPIEKIWTMVKSYVAAHNVTFKIADVDKLARDKFSAITLDKWKELCSHVDKFEQELLEKERMYDNQLDEFVFATGTGSSDEEQLSSEKESTEELSGSE